MHEHAIQPREPKEDNLKHGNADQGEGISQKGMTELRIAAFLEVPFADVHGMQDIRWMVTHFNEKGITDHEEISKELNKIINRAGKLKFGESKLKMLKRKLTIKTWQIRTTKTQ